MKAIFKKVMTFLVVSQIAACLAMKVWKDEQRQRYSEYRLSMERLNMEREKTGLNPSYILTFDEWFGKN